IPDRRPSDFSPSNQFAIRALLEYCLDVNGRFDSKNCGMWPSPHPLFPVCDLQTAEANFDLLLKWVFSPSSKTLVNELSEGVSPTELLGGLLADWASILIGPAAGAAATGSRSKACDRTRERSEAPAPPLDAAAMLTVLLKRAAATIDRTQKQELIFYWKTIESLSLDIGSRREHSDPVRKELLWRRSLLSKIAEQFRVLWAEIAAGSSAS
ncbi:MAG: hypothetical protein ACREAC_03175, partial [Blastocatellia bacterium]